MQPLAILKPDSVAQAIAMHGADAAARYLAGGTDLVPNLRRNIQKAKTLIDVSGLAELREIRQESQSLRIGAGVTLEALCASDAVREATGLELHDFPLTPERIAEALEAREREQRAAARKASRQPATEGAA